MCINIYVIYVLNRRAASLTQVDNFHINMAANATAAYYAHLQLQMTIDRWINKRRFRDFRSYLIKRLARVQTRVVSPRWCSKVVKTLETTRDRWKSFRCTDNARISRVEAAVYLFFKKKNSNDESSTTLFVITIARFRAMSDWDILLNLKRGNVRYEESKIALTWV